MILHNLSSGIITLNDSNIKYFNKMGEKLLNEAVAVIDSDNTSNKSMLHQGVQELGEDFKNLSPVKMRDKTQEKVHETILGNPVFKLYMKNRKKLD
jgi:hypothetical protein